MDNYLILFLIIGIFGLLFYFKDKIIKYFLPGREKNKFNNHRIKYTKRKNKINSVNKSKSIDKNSMTESPKEDTDIDDIFIDESVQKNDNNSMGSNSLLSNSLLSDGELSNDEISNDLLSNDSKFSGSINTKSYSLDSRSGLSEGSMMSGSNESRISCMSSNGSFGTNISDDRESALSVMDR